MLALTDCRLRNTLKIFWFIKRAYRSKSWWTRTVTSQNNLNTITLRLIRPRRVTSFSNSFCRKMGLRFFVFLVLLGLIFSTLSVDAKSLKGKRIFVEHISHWSHCGSRKKNAFAINASDSESRYTFCAFLCLESISTRLHWISLCYGWISSTS